ncbi:MAG: helix-turn-helix transcriptional regulator [Planctomycetes bacterium]|nr:helix-turn-helix transcriptional regulator [Planctomycetota bacterium]
MAAPGRTLLGLIEASLRIELDDCGVTPIGPGHDTGWRTLPGCVVAAVTGADGEIERRGAPTIVMPAGGCLIVPPLVFHRGHVTGSRSGVSRWSLFQARIFTSVDVLGLYTVPDVIHGAAATRLGDLNQELAACGAGDLGAVIRRQEILHRILRVVIDHATPRNDGLALLGHAERLAPILAYIDAHLAQPLSRAGLARLAGLSPSRFHAVFHAATGAAPLDYILRQRIQRAQRLLLTSARDIQDIAAAVGFADPFHFSRLFRRRCGQSPTAYRGADRA